MNAYLKYWNTDAPVFARALPVAKLFLPHALTSKLERLKLACEQSQTLIALTGDSGTGKSTALRWLGQNLPTLTHEYLIATLVKREHGPGWLTPRLAELMGVKGAGLPLDQLLRATAARFDELIAEKRSLVVAIDAAHLLQSAAALEELAAFLNLQAFAGRCLTFVLCGGDPVLDTLAAAPELAGKLALHTHLSPLTRDETAAYIEHRLKVAGVSAAFEDQAIDVIHLRTRGVLAAVDVAADNCLTEAYQKNLRRIGADMAKLAAASLASFGKRPAALTASLDEDDRPMSLARLAAGDPPPRAQAVAAPPASRDKGLMPHGDAASPEASEPRPKDTSSIKLASLFKADGAKSKP